MVKSKSLLLVTSLCEMVVLNHLQRSFFMARYLSVLRPNGNRDISATMGSSKDQLHNETISDVTLSQFKATHLLLAAAVGDKRRTLRELRTSTSATRVAE